VEMSCGMLLPEGGHNSRSKLLPLGFLYGILGGVLASHKVGAIIFDINSLGSGAPTYCEGILYRYYVVDCFAFPVKG